MSGLDEKEEKEEKEIIEEAMKDPDAYEGCPLCLGKGSIADATATWGYICPKCKGHLIVKKEEPSLFEKWAKERE